MYKFHRDRPLVEAQTKRSRHLSKTRYVVEQSFGTLHPQFRYANERADLAHFLMLTILC